MWVSPQQDSWHHMKNIDLNFNVIVWWWLTA